VCPTIVPCARVPCPSPTLVLCTRAEYYDTYVRSASDQFLIPAVLRVRMYVSAREAMSARLTLSRRNIMLRDKCTCQCARAPASPVACTGARPPYSESSLAAALGLVVVPACQPSCTPQCVANASACCPGMVVRARLARRPARTLGGGAGLGLGVGGLAGIGGGGGGWTSHRSGVPWSRQVLRRAGQCDGAPCGAALCGQGVVQSLARPGRARYCGVRTNLTVDHVVPLSKGGKWAWENLVTACTRCNGKKARPG